MVRTLWQVRSTNDEIEFCDIYAEYPTLVAFKLHHGGRFTKFPGRKYIKGKTHFIQLVDTDAFSVLELDDMMYEIGYKTPRPTYYHFLVPGKDLDNGLHALGSDMDVIQMLKFVPECKLFEIYTEHWLTRLNTYDISPGISKVVIEELPDEVPSELSRVKKKGSKKEKPLLLEWIDEGKDVDGDNDRKEKWKDEGKDVDGDKDRKGKGKESVGIDLELDILDGIDSSMFYDFDPFDNVGINTSNVEMNTSNVEMNTSNVEMNTDIDHEGMNTSNVEMNTDIDHEGMNTSNVEMNIDIDHEGMNTDSDADFEEEVLNSVDEVHVDMNTFRANIDVEAEWVEHGDVVTETPNVDGDVDVVQMDEMHSNSDDSDLEAERNSLLRKLRKEKNFTVEDMEETVSFFVGQDFGSKEGIKRLIDLHGIQTKRQIYVIKNDSTRIRAICRGALPELNKEYDGGPCKAATSQKEGTSEIATSQRGGTSETAASKNEGASGDKEGCHWVLYISKGKKDATWTVKTYEPEHQCLQTMRVKSCTASFLSKDIVETVSNNPEIPIKALQVQMQRKFGQKFSQMKAFRAKTMAVDKLRGNYGEQYNHLRDYALELLRTNPGTTVKIDVESEANLQCEARRFKRIYICFGALKNGFKAAQRDFLGLDGAFMKGPFPGQIITAVGLDSNNGTYPVAYAIVEAETTNYWTWFLELLGDDLDLNVRSNFTFISDRQKGIIPAIAKVFPSAEHRFCLRHINENMKLSWRGKEFKDLLWNCAVAPTVPEFNEAMNRLKAKSTKAYEWLKEIPPHHWSRSHFTGRSHTDCLLNNICEVFNRQLVDGRDKPIITCLEYIREYLMKRIGNVNQVMQRAIGPLTPTATKVLESIKKEAMNYKVIWNGGCKYQVNGPWLDNCVVDITEKVCSCRIWELTGIPCKHAVATIREMSRNGVDVDIPEFWVHEAYWLSTWKKMYDFHLQPINGPKMWPKSDCPSKLLPPTHHKQVGRPKKKRKKGITEITEGKRLRRVGKTVRCVNCNQEGHNKRTCKGQAP